MGVRQSGDTGRHGGGGPRDRVESCSRNGAGESDRGRRFHSIETSADLFYNRYFAGRAFATSCNTRLARLGDDLCSAAEEIQKKQANTTGKAFKVRQAVQQQAQAQINARTRGFFDFIRGPNKREWLENFFLMKLPYHPQWYRSGTRFDAVLEKPLDFGNVTISSQTLQAMGSTPPPDSTVQMRILTTVSSVDAHTGDPMQGVLSQPLFTPDKKVVLPTGTRLNGKITLAKPARMLHRGGKLRFAIESVEVPTVTAQANPSSPVELGQPQATQAQLAAVEADPNAVKVDQEGTAKATESKTRFLRPAIAGLVAAKSMDNDEGRQTASGTGGGYASGQSLGGFSGFGLRESRHLKDRRR